MAAIQSLSSSVAVLLLLTALAVQTQLAHSQQCTSQLNNLNVMTVSAALSRSRRAFLLNAVFHLSLVLTRRYRTSMEPAGGRQESDRRIMSEL
ncbi:hypothetical protein OIU74_017266 [Salix koriyanagi]|uniref:Uncharacterized protein n=1 Tax=Salix koriyanagi TaxID=2511006 RepID=A0A9Q0STF6_9ROSI|nr:hypothetical protein OIU74_017266 [Salix koriyanagi]